MKTIGRIAMALAVVMLAGSCASCKDNGDDDSDIILTMSDNGRAVTMLNGQRLEIALTGHPTAGYEWSVEQADAKVLESSSSTVKPQSDLLGAPSEYVFRFRAVAAGSTPVRLIYKRPFESKVENTFQVQVAVR